MQVDETELACRGEGIARGVEAGGIDAQIDVAERPQRAIGIQHRCRRSLDENRIESTRAQKFDRVCRTLDPERLTQPG